ncbi:tight adherence protein B [Elusimicrobium posterum]|uniref:type II secretion system F family protein n=1 Tax=Elusimicrobium posterum TaxID=3116653 RepID=UPI003C71B967
MRKLLLTLFSVAFLSGLVSAQGFSDEQKKVISCGRAKVRVLYDFMMPGASKRAHMLGPECSATDKEEAVVMPEWFIKDIPNMSQRSVVWNPQEKITIMERDVWEHAFSNIHQFLDRSEGLFDDKEIDLSDNLAGQFSNTKANYLLTLDRLNKVILDGKTAYSMRDSFGGRARAIYSTLELINSEMDSAIEAFSGPSSTREERFTKAMTGMGMLTNNLYDQLLYKDPIPLVPNYTTAADAKKNLSPWIAIMIGSLIVFFGIFYWLSSQEESINTSIENYLRRSDSWAEDFNRQFININVKYIVLGTVLVFAAIGVLFGLGVGGFLGIIVFLGFVFAGASYGKKMPGIVLKRLKQARGAKINAQIMDALILLSNSLKSGMDIVQGFEMVNKDMIPPISDEFGLVIKNYQLGNTFERALDTMEERVENRLLSYMIKAIVLQRQVGGNLTKIFERIVETIREESKLEEKLQAMTAQQRIQSIVVGIMPWLMVSVMFMFRPDEMISFYTSGVGLLVLMFCLFWIMIGMRMVSKLGEVKV